MQLGARSTRVCGTAIVEVAAAKRTVTDVMRLIIMALVKDSDRVEKVFEITRRAGSWWLLSECLCVVD